MLIDCEENVFRFCFGLDDGCMCMFEEVGKVFGVMCECIC